PAIDQRLRGEGREGFAIGAQYGHVGKLWRRFLDFGFDRPMRDEPFAQSYAAPRRGAQGNDQYGKDKTPGHPYPQSSHVGAVYKLAAPTADRTPVPRVRAWRESLRPDTAPGPRAVVQVRLPGTPPHPPRRRQCLRHWHP